MDIAAQWMKLIFHIDGGDVSGDHDRISTTDTVAYQIALLSVHNGLDLLDSCKCFIKSAIRMKILYPLLFST